MFSSWLCPHFEPVLYSTHYEPYVMYTPEDLLVFWPHNVQWIPGQMRLRLWKIWCLHHGGVWLHHVNAFVFGNIPNFAQACESSWNLGRVFSMCACYVFPDLLGSDLLFFTSPTYQPPVSVAVKRNGWYFRGELVFPFIASIFYFNVSECEYHCWAGM